MAALDYSSPLQFWNRGQLVIAETKAISLWDVNSLHPEAQPISSTSGPKKYHFPILASFLFSSLFFLHIGLSVNI